MDYTNFQEALTLSVRLFLQHERSLFTAYAENMREEAISHQLACKIGYVFRDYDVDCEYSRQPDGNKKQNDLGENKRPDIIIHKRGPAGPNLALIEIKWRKNGRDDTEKVTQFTNLGYSFGVVVRFDGSGNVVQLKIYDYQSATWHTDLADEA